VLPAVKNAVYNRVLKLVAEQVKIKKHLTTHVGRKTFATIMDQNGVSTKTISDMLGNTLQVCQKHHLAKSTRRIEKELAALHLLTA
jgi:integrase/recombinase XerD